GAVVVVDEVYAARQRPGFSDNHARVRRESRRGNGERAGGGDLEGRVVGARNRRRRTAGDVGRPGDRSGHCIRRGNALVARVVQGRAKDVRAIVAGQEGVVTGHGRGVAAREVRGARIAGRGV